MKGVVFFFFLALGTTNAVGPTTTDRIKTAIDKNIQWLLRGVRSGRFLGPDFARAVVALFLSEPGYFSDGHKIGRELKNSIPKNFRPLILRWNDEPSFIPSVELAWYVQALVVSCMDPSNFFGYSLLDVLWRTALHDCRLLGVCNFPSFVLLTLCTAGAITSPFDLQRIAPYYLYLSDEEAFTTMSIACLESHGIWNTSDSNSIPIRSSGYRHHPSNLTVEKLQELMNPDDDGNTAPFSDIAAAMQTLMSNHLLQVSYLPWAVDFLLKSQDKDGSWGQSTLNSFFVLPVLSNKCFLDISREHCPAVESGNDEDLLLENEELKEPKDCRRVVIYIRNDTYTLRYSIIRRTFGKISTLYDELTLHSNKAVYLNGTDGEPYLISLLGIENNPETGYIWFTYERTKYPKETLTLLTQSHADIKLRRDRSYVLWYSQRSTQEAYGRPKVLRQQAAGKEIQFLVLPLVKRIT